MKAPSQPDVHIHPHTNPHAAASANTVAAAHVATTTVSTKTHTRTAKPLARILSPFVVFIALVSICMFFAIAWNAPPLHGLNLFEGDAAADAARARARSGMGEGIGGPNVGVAGVVVDNEDNNDDDDDEAEEVAEGKQADWGGFSTAEDGVINQAGAGHAAGDDGNPKAPTRVEDGMQQTDEARSNEQRQQAAGKGRGDHPSTKGETGDELQKASDVAVQPQSEKKRQEQETSSESESEPVAVAEVKPEPRKSDPVSAAESQSQSAVERRPPGKQPQPPSREEKVPQTQLESKQESSSSTTTDNREASKQNTRAPVEKQPAQKSSSETVVVTPRRQPQSPSPPSPPSAAKPTRALPDDAQECLLLTRKDPGDQSYPFNARSYCLASTMCFERVFNVSRPPMVYMAAKRSVTRCRAVTASLMHPALQTPNCTWLQENVHCAQGAYEFPGDPVCPSMRPLSQLSERDLKRADWLSGIAVLAPAYPYMGNVYHYSFIISSVAHITASLPVLLSKWRDTLTSTTSSGLLPVTLVFRGELPESLGTWQQGIVSALVKHRFRDAGLDVRVTSWNETDIMAPRGSLACAQRVVMMGKRWALSLWPFANSTDVPTDGSEVSIEAIAVRTAAYKAAGVQTRLPHLPMGAMQPPPKRAIFDLPPKVIGYARRNGAPDPTPENPVVEGTTRRFSDADEKWFVNMLRAEAARGNMTYTVLETPGGMSFESQTAMFADVGVIVGIHGANLLNAIFSRPFSALMEVRVIDSPCYWAGANSGLAYWSHMPERQATWQESGCRDDGCDPNHRRVMVGAKVERQAIQTIVRKQVDHVNRLHRTFRKLGGVPVVYDEELALYRIAWGRR